MSQHRVDGKNESMLITAGRLSRHDYFMHAMLPIIGLVVIGVFIFSVMIPLHGWEPTRASIFMATLMSVPFVIIPVWVFWASTIRRCHDLSRSGWFALWCLLPIIGNLVWIWIACKEGDKADNQYGAYVE